MNTDVKLQKIRQAAQHALEASPVQKRSWWRKLAQVLAVDLLFVVVMAGALSPVKTPWDMVWGMTGFMLILLLNFGLFAAVSPQRHPSARVSVIWAVVVAFLTLGVATHWSNGLPLLPAGLPCWAMEWGLSIAPVSLAIVLLRCFAYHPLRTWLGILASGLVGLFTLHWHCQVLTGEHVLWFHLVPWLLVGVVGVWIRSRLSSKTFVP